MGQEGRIVLLKLMIKIRQTNEIPRDWELAVILLLLKKGDAKDCDSYRGIHISAEYPHEIL